MSEPKEVIVNNDAEVVVEESFTADVQEGQEGIKISIETT